MQRAQPRRHAKAIDGNRAADLLPIVRANLSREARFMTDEIYSYKYVAEFAELTHESVKHSQKEYVRGDIHTNTVEGYYSIFKRGMKLR
jgi:hypothetical protein